MRSPLRLKWLGLLACTLSALIAPAAVAIAEPAVEDARGVVAAPAGIGPTAPPAAPLTMAGFLDRLMLAESGGRDTAANPRSTALGPFQFIVSTFLVQARRHFAAELAELSPAQILSLRTDRAFARRVAEAHTYDNAAHLARAGIAPTWPHLRLAFFAGADGAIRVIRADPAASVSTVLRSAALTANPFLRRMTAADLVARSERDLIHPATGSATGTLPLPTTKPPAKAAVAARCELARASCRRWVALAKRRQQRSAATGRAL